MSEIKDKHQAYLGDGVYASFDGYQIWLKTLEGNSIALEPEVFKALREYADQLVEILEKELKIRADEKAMRE